ncbi:hypothetical protein ACLMAJ_18320 [Nocardia sp. KC 131]|jgi:hypothetical protein|uniref:hypothetical protein n=1 Tax=Nocardia arseniciresistens TaxID=3392119 RepID=UPI00398F2F93
MKPKAIGFLRRDVSGIRQGRHEMEIRSRARELGYDLARMVTLGPSTDAIDRLIAMLHRLNAAAVIAPSAEHVIDARDKLCAVCDLLTVTPQQTWPATRPLTDSPAASRPPNR